MLLSLAITFFGQKVLYLAIFKMKYILESFSLLSGWPVQFNFGDPSSKCQERMRCL